MKNLWDTQEASNFSSDLALRVYTSNLLGHDDTLVLHGGGNTSVKSTLNGEEILYVKGSGWDLVSIRAEGFAPVKLAPLQEMASYENLSDTNMVRLQKEAMIDPKAPNPSVEAILHAIIPYKYVDHTHADAIVTLSNTVNGEKIMKELFPSFLILPYVMPGFLLAKTIFELTQDNFDWGSCEGIILHHHGIFTFDNDPRASYSKMIAAVTKAEIYLSIHAPLVLNAPSSKNNNFPFPHLCERIEESKGYEIVALLDQSPLAIYYSQLSTEKLTRGVLTPEHIIRTKREPLVLKNRDTIEQKLLEYKKQYELYFDQFATQEMIMLDPTPNYAVIEGFGVVSFGKNEKEAGIIYDIVTHTMEAVLRGDLLGGYKSIDLSSSFAMEYWELEQAKLKIRRQ